MVEFVGVMSGSSVIGWRVVFVRSGRTFTAEDAEIAEGKLFCGRGLWWLEKCGARMGAARWFTLCVRALWLNGVLTVLAWGVHRHAQSG